MPKVKSLVKVQCGNQWIVGEVQDINPNDRTALVQIETGEVGHWSIDKIQF